MVERAWSALCMELRNSVRGLKAGQFQLSEQDQIKGTNSSDRGNTSSSFDTRQQGLLNEKYDRESNPDQYKDDYFLERLEHSTHASRNDYASGIKRYLSYFSKEQLLIVDYRQLSLHPKETIEQICCFLGLSREEILQFVDTLDEDVLSKRVNAANTSNYKIRLSLRKKMEQHLNPCVIKFNRLLEELGYDWKI
uniref:Sulfotransferase domain-containing protein n=1 Tax=Ditylum brightwellii TaxID=49249 RepID=A0A7S1YS28_9STRA